MTLPIDTTTLTAAASNQVPNMVLASALNIAALQTLFDNAAEMYTYVQAFSAPGAIGTANLADLSVITSKIALLAVTAAQIANNTITSAQIANATITSVQLALLSVENANLATGIDPAKLADGSVSATEFQCINGLTSNAQAQIDSKAPLTHVGSNGSAQHAVADVSNAGFMSSADYLKLSSIITTSLPSFIVPADVYITFGSRFKQGYNSTTDTLDTYET